MAHARRLMAVAAGLAALGMVVSKPASAASSGPQSNGASLRHSNHAVRSAQSSGYRDLYSTGPGGSFGFAPARGPRPYGPAAYRRARQTQAVRETMAIDQLTRGYGYGSPFYAGYYGPGIGPQTGVGRGY